MAYSTRATQRTSPEPREVETNESAAGLTRDVLFGRTTQGMKLIYASSFANSQLLYLVAAIGEGPVQSIVPRVDDKPLAYASGAAGGTTGALYNGASNLMSVWVYDGSRTGFQETASQLSAFDPSWVTTAAYNNLAFAVIRLQYNEQSLNSIPKVTFEVQGYRDVLLNPNGGAPSRGYTENAALIIREIMTNTRWGMKIPVANIDDATFGIAAADCATPVFAAPPTSPVNASVITGVGGNLNGIYRWRMTFVNANGVESAASPPAIGWITVNEGGQPRNASLALPAGDALTATRKLYRASFHATAPIYRLVATFTGNSQTTYTDSMSDSAIAGQPVGSGVGPLSNIRYPLGINVGKQSTAADWLDTLRAHCLGVFTFEDGKYQLRIDKALPGGTEKAKYSELHNLTTGAKPNVVPGSVRWGRKRRSELFNEVEIHYTDLQNNYAQGTVVKSRQAVINGTEVARRATYELPGLFDNSVAARVATQMLNLAWDDASFDWETDRSAIRTTPWDVVQLTGGGLVDQDVRVRSIVATPAGFKISGTEYNPNSYSDAVVQADAPLVGGTVGVVRTDDLNPPASLAAIEEVDEPQPGIFLPKLVVSFSPNFSPGYGGTVLTYQVGAGAEKTHGTFYNSPVAIPMPQPGQTVTVRAYTAHKSGAIGATPVSTTVVMYDPNNPEPVGQIIVPAGTDEAYWDKPPARNAAVAYGGSQWTASGTSIFTAAQVNNGDLTTQALQFNVASVGWLRVDATTAQVMREVEVVWLDPDPSPSTRPSFDIQWSDDNSTFTSVGSYSIHKVSTLRTAWSWANVGAHRYWRIQKGSTSANAHRISEVRFRYFTGGVYPYVKGYRLTGFTPGGTGAKYSKDITAQPTATQNRIPLSEFRYSWSSTDPVTGQSLGGGSAMELTVQTISPTNVVADGRMLGLYSIFSAGSVAGPLRFLPLDQADYPPSNGANVNCGATNDYEINLVRFTGSASNWSIGGLLNGGPGRIVTLVNATAGEGTFLHEDGNSTAANRISMPDSTAAALPVNGTITLIYDQASSRWRRLDRVSNAVDKVRPISTTYGALDVKGTNNGYAGIHFVDVGRVLMMQAQYQGVWGPAIGWQWYWNNGTLEAGTIPGARISAPRTAYLNNLPQVAQELAWRYYGNSHTVVDNSGAHYRPNQADPDVEWTTQYPALMGFNGSNTYGVRVDRARYAEQLKSGATVPTPAAADNTTTVANTAWVRANAGGGMERVAQLSPSGPYYPVGGGLATVGSKPQGFLTNRGYGSATTNTSVVSISGKGVLRFLSGGSYYNNSPGYMTLVIDGTTILNDVPLPYQYQHYGDPGFNSVYVGSIVASVQATGDIDLSAVPSDYGITFKSSLVIYARTQVVYYSVYVNYAYSVY
jgi:hypothetical protein